MKKGKRISAVLLILFLLAGCGRGAAVGDESAGESVSGISGQTAGETSGGGESEISGDTGEMFSEGDYEGDYDESTGVHITLEGASAKSDSDTVKISGSVITISDGGTYIFTGTLENGMIIVEAEKTDRIQLVLDGASVNSNTSAAIYIVQADQVFLTLAADSENTLSNGGEFIAVDENDIDSAVFSKEDLTLNGKGGLTVASPAGHGIVSKDDLVVTGGEYRINCLRHGLCGRDSVRIGGGSFTVVSGKDGIHAENTEDTALGFVYITEGTYHITADGDGISASGYLQIENGEYTIETGGGSSTVTKGADGSWGWERPGEQQSTDITEDTVSAKGIKASGNLSVSGGTFCVDSADDGVHSNADLTVSGGTFRLSAGDDGFHGDQTVTVVNGTITITGSYEGIEGQNIVISGGTIDLVSSDDGLNAAGGNDRSGDGGFGGFREKESFDTASAASLDISGGTIHINASGDGVDSNGDLRISGGETYVSGPSDSGNGALDYGGEATITGGVFAAAGASGMAQNFGSSSTQGAMLVSLGSDSENSEITLKDENGNNLLVCTMEKTFSCILLSCPEIVQGKTYTVSAGGVSESVTMESLIYGSGTGMGENPGGGRGGNPGGGMGTPPGGREGLSQDKGEIPGERNNQNGA